MKTTTCLWASAFLFCAAASFAGPLNGPAIIPQPQQILRSDGAFALTPQTRICAASGSRQTAEFLAKRLRQSTGFPFKIDAKPLSGAPAPDEIWLTTNQAGANLGAEGYEMVVDAHSVLIRAPTAAGLFYGAQTLLQSLPPEVFSSNVVTTADWRIPCVHITDWPRFAWRGLMLDVSRHFFTKPELESLFDAMALHKINTFHWHLVDDQGWRIEIKKYPRLTQVGAWRDGIGFNLDAASSTNYGPDGRYGGFYTQKDIRDLVAYGQKLHITIVPEIEMPAHASAALLAYPQFLCPGVTNLGLPTNGGIFHGIYCAGNEASFAFIDDVLSEVARLFPGKYIHIGGDECPKDNWKQCPLCQDRIKKEGLKDEHELQSYFIRRVETILHARGKTLIGWSEIRDGGLAPGAALMDWKGGGDEAAASGHDVVMTPQNYCYLSKPQTTNRSVLARAVRRPLLLDDVYLFDPIPTNLPPQFQAHILGAQGSVWSESIPNLKRAEYMIFPRLSALAEATWSAKDARNLEDFRRRLPTDERRLAELGVNYFSEPSP